MTHEMLGEQLFVDVGNVAVARELADDGVALGVAQVLAVDALLELEVLCQMLVVVKMRNIVAVAVVAVLAGKPVGLVGTRTGVCVVHAVAPGVVA